MEIFLKRAEKPFKEKIGEDKTHSLFQELKKELNLIPGEFSGSLGPEIPRLLFKYSQDIEEISEDVVEGILNHFLVFTNSLKDLSNQNIKQVNQKIINRSKSKMRNLSDLLINFVIEAKNGNLMKKSGKFDEILDFLVGGKREVTQFDDLKLFIKRASDNFENKVGEEFVKKFSDSFYQSLKKIDETIKGTVDSDVVKYLFKLSQDISRLKPDKLKYILNGALVFTNSLTDLRGKNKNQIDQEIIKRSKNKMRGLFDLFKNFLEMEKEVESTKSASNIDDLITIVLGDEEKFVRFSDVGGFLKRVEEKYVKMLGEIKAINLIDKILTVLTEIPEEHGAYLASDISRYLTKYSETMFSLEPKEVENILTRTLMYAGSLKDIVDLTREEINQFILNRSKSKARNLFDLYKLFLETVKPIFIKSKNPGFDEIVDYTLGKYQGPKVIKEIANLHNLLEKYQEEIPLAKEHAKWADALKIILSRYIEILQSDDGNFIFDQLWNNSYPQNKINENFQEKLAILPREDERTFTFRLMNFLTRQVLTKKKPDCALTGSVAFVILGKILLEIFSGRNCMIRAIKVNQLIKERKFADLEKKKEIDEFINNIIKEDLKAIKKRIMVVKSVIPILTIKGFYIQTYDINRKNFPELFVDMFTDVSPLENIGKEYIKTQKGLNTLGNLNGLYYYLNLIQKFDKHFFKEAESTPLDSVKKRSILGDYFKRFFDLHENLEIDRFYDHSIISTDRLTFIYILKYIYEPSKNAFDLVENFMEEYQDFIKVKSMDYYLSNLKLRECKINIEQLNEDIQNAVAEGSSDESEKMIRLKNMLDQQKRELSLYHFMDDLFNNAKDVVPILDSRIIFSRELLTFIDIVKNINRNLSAIIPKYFENLTEFSNEIEKVLKKVRGIKAKNLISPAEFYDINQAVEIATQRISELTSDEKFTKHINKMVEAYNNNVLYSELTKEPVEQEEVDELIEEINPLEKYFTKYLEELTAVRSTDSFNKFMEAFNFWLRDEIFPVTYNKAEQVLLKIMFKKIKKKYLSEIETE